MIKVINAYKEFDDNGEVTIALNHINITLPNNGLIVISGESGSGKTTLLNCLSGLDKLTSGEIQGINKEDVGFIFQDY